MPNCNVQSCKSHSGRVPKVTLHTFPKDRELAERWLVLCRCDERGTLKSSIGRYKFTNKDRICSLHFPDNSYEDRNLKAELMNTPTSRRLKRDAVPTLLLPSPTVTVSTVSTVSRPSSEARIARKDAEYNRKRVLMETVGPEYLRACPSKKKPATSTCSKTPQCEDADSADTPSVDALEPGIAEAQEAQDFIPISLVEEVVSQDKENVEMVVDLEPEYTYEVHSFENEMNPDILCLVSDGSSTGQGLISAENQNADRTQTEVCSSCKCSCKVAKKFTDAATQVPEPKVLGNEAITAFDHGYAKSKTKKKRRATKAINNNDVSSVNKCDPRDLLEDSVEADTVEAVPEEKGDPDYEPESDSSGSDSESEAEPLHEATSAEGFVNDRKFIVFESQLKKLFFQCRCNVCNNIFLIQDMGSTVGTGLSISLECINGHSWVWHSQPMVGRMPIGNLLVSAAILFSGNLFEKIATFAGFLNLEFLSYSSFKDHQKDYLFPAVHSAWEDERQALWSSLDGRSVRLSGDGRCDSPGYSAKFCTYTMMDMDTQKVVDFEVVQVSQTTSSVAMEKKGFQNVTTRMLESGMSIKLICTDRHIGIGALMKKEFIGIEHQVDVWHLAKSVLKHLLQSSKRKECEGLAEWIPSIKNHLWWSAKTCGGDKVELVERWRSVGHHVTNKHEWDANQKFHACSHAPISSDTARRTKWLKPDSPPHQALTSVLNKKHLLSGVEKITKFCHTGELEVYHNVVTKYAPKRVHFPYESMVVRTKLAALDHNHNTGRTQAHTKKGNVPRYRVACPKQKKAWIVKPVYEGKQYGYVYDLIGSVVSRKIVNDTFSIFTMPALSANIAPPDIERPTKEQLTAVHRSRFSM